MHLELPEMGKSWSFAELLQRTITEMKHCKVLELMFDVHE